MHVKFWGSRGSTPTPERRNSRYGGNTTCIEVRLANGTLIILDCGSGVRGLGKSLLREYGERPIHAYIFLTHFHWDHIQGIPFFLPVYRKGNVFLFHSVLRKGLELKGAVEGQMVNPYFPVDMSAMGSTRHFYDLDENPINLNGAVISSAPLNHPGECVAYRIDADGASFVLATDTEPGSTFHDLAVRDLARGVDVLVYDAQYTPEQLQGEKRGWGHSSWAEGTRIAQECGVKHLVLCHHDPDHDDIFIDGLVQKARQEFPRVSGGTEGMTLELPAGTLNFAGPAEASDRRRERRYALELPVRLGWKEEDGSDMEVEGTAQDMSSSGAFFVVPPEVRTDRPLMMEVILPDEITHRGDVKLRFVAKPLRQELLNGALGSYESQLGVAAKIESMEEEPAQEIPLLKKEKHK